LEALTFSLTARWVRNARRLGRRASRPVRLEPCAGVALAGVWMPAPSRSRAPGCLWYCTRSVPPVATSRPAQSYAARGAPSRARWARPSAQSSSPFVGQSRFDFAAPWCIIFETGGRRRDGFGVNAALRAAETYRGGSEAGSAPTGSRRADRKSSP